MLSMRKFWFYQVGWVEAVELTHVHWRFIGRVHSDRLCGVVVFLVVCTQGLCPNYMIWLIVWRHFTFRLDRVCVCCV